MLKIKWLIGHIVLDFGVVITNLYEEYLMTRRWRSLDSMDDLLLSLSISDLVCGLAFLALDIYTMIMVSTPYIDFDNHQIADRIWDSFCLFSVFASALHVVAVAADRICAIRFQKKYHIFTNFRCKCIILCVIWTCTLSTTLSFSALTIYTNDIYFGLELRADALAAFTGIVVVMYIFVMLFYWLRKRTMEDTAVQDPNLHYKVLKPYTLISFLLGMNFVVCVSPITYSYFQPLVFHPIGDVMFTLKSILNPWIYFTKILFKSRYFNRILPDSSVVQRDRRHLTSQRERRHDVSSITMTTTDNVFDGVGRGTNDDEHVGLV